EAQYNVKADPLLPIRAAGVAAGTGLTITPSLLEALENCPPMLEPWNSEAQESLTKFLQGTNHLITVWEAFDYGKFWGKWIPFWEGVRNRPQHSPVHEFT